MVAGSAASENTVTSVRIDLFMIAVLLVATCPPEGSGAHQDTFVNTSQEGDQAPID